MATDVERLVVSLEASITKFERTMAKASGAADASARKIERRFEGMQQKLGAGFAGLQSRIATAFATAAAVRGATQLIDSATRIENSLKVAGLAGEELEQVYARLRDAALANAAPLESLVTLYGRASLVQKELGVSTDQLLQFSNSVALALRASGQSAQESSGALLQLSQALGSGVVRAEEFNSILEGAPTILQAAAAGIREADGSVAKLRAIMLEGNLSSKALFDGFLAGSSILEDKVAGSALTVSQAMENLQTRLIDLARDFDKGTGASKLLADGIINLGDGLADLAVFLDNMAGPIQTFVSNMNQGIAAAQGLAAEIARITGLENIGFNAAVATNNLTGGAGLSASSSAAGRVVSQTFEMIGKTPKDEALARALAGEQPAQEPLKITVTRDPISIADPQYKASSTSGGAGARGGSGGGALRADQFASEVASQEKRIAQLQRETELRRTLNPLINDYGFAMERLKAQMELENAAKEAGIPLDDRRRQQINDLSTGYANATVEAARLAEAQDQAKQAADELAQAGRAALDTIVDGFLEGKDAGEIFNDVLKNLTKSLINMGLNGLFGGGGAGGGGFLSGLFGGGGGMKLFARGGVSNQPAIFGEAGPEAAVPLPDGRRIPVDLRMPSLASAGGSGAVIKVELSPDLEGRIVATAGRQSVSIVSASAPSIAEQGATKAGQKLAGGDFNRGMATYGLKQQAKRR